MERDVLADLRMERNALAVASARLRTACATALQTARVSARGEWDSSCKPLVVAHGLTLSKEGSEMLTALLGSIAETGPGTPIGGLWKPGTRATASPTDASSDSADETRQAEARLVAKQTLLNARWGSSLPEAASATMRGLSDVAGVEWPLLSLMPHLDDQSRAEHLSTTASASIAPEQDRPPDQK
jgi:hypothetical protein